MKSVERLFFAAALVLYGVGIGWGVPPINTVPSATSWGPDELAPTGLLEEVANRLYVHWGNYNPQYPLFGYLQQAVPVRVILGVAGYDVRESNSLEVARPTTFIARASNVVLAAATVVVAARTAAIFFGAGSAWIAALFTLLFQPMFYYGRTSNVDGPSLFWTAVVIWQAAHAIRFGLERRSAIIMAVAAACSIATKDSAYGAILPVGLIVAAYSWKKHSTLLIVAGFVSIVVYIFASGLAFDLKSWTMHVEFISKGNLRHFGFHYGNKSPYVLVFWRTLVEVAANLGVPVLMAVAVGILLAVRRNRGLLIWLLPAAGVIVFSILPQRFVLYRFTIQTSYVLLFFAVYLIHHLIEWKRSIGIAAMVCISSWSAVTAADFTWQMWNDTRYQAADWINTHAKPGDRIGYYGRNLKKPAYIAPHFIYERGPLSLPAEKGPEYLVVMPWFDYEQEHEYDLPEVTYQAMLNGLHGYKLVLDIRTPALFPAEPGRFVNPPVRIFRRDLP